MNRRAFVLALLALYGCGRQEQAKKAAQAPQPAAATQPHVPRIGILYFGLSGPGGAQVTDIFRKRLAELGYVDGKTVVIEERFANGDPQRLAELARELVASKVDVIVTPAIAATVAARDATNTIPIVMVHAGDPFRAGLISNLARPGGNITGTINFSHGGKQVDLMRELLPRVRKLVVLVNPTNSNAVTVVQTATEAAHKFDIGLVAVEVRRDDDFPAAFAKIRNARPDGLVVAMEPLLATHNDELIAFAAKARLPAIYDVGEMARRGGLIAYGTLFSEHYRIAADYVDKILKGAKPGDLPVQQPQRFELIVNAKTAKALRLTIPQPLLLRADEVIQ
jgi:putative ABC transport system substrate-binding protein